MARTLLCLSVLLLISGCAAWRGERPDTAQAAVAELAAQGDAEAQTAHGLNLEWGHGVGQDYVLAAEWHVRAAKQGNPLAAYYLGQLFERGLGVEQDYRMAAGWYRRAAKAGNASAQFKLGNLYEHGLGVRQDYDVATRWYQRAGAHWLPEGTYPPGAERVLGPARPTPKLRPPRLELLTLVPPAPAGAGHSAPKDPAMATTIAVKQIDDTPIESASPDLATLWWAHIASYRHRDRIAIGWEKLLSQHQELLSPHGLSVARVDLGPEKGIFFRLRAGPLPNRAAAMALCSALRARELYCAPDHNG